MNLESSPNVSKLIEYMNSSKAKTAFPEILQVIRELTDDELIMVYQKDSAKSSLGNVTNEVVRGIIQSAIKNRDLRDKLSGPTIEDEKTIPITLSGSVFEASIVSSDKTTRGREPLKFGNSQLKEQFGLEPIYGLYKRRIPGGVNKRASGNSDTSDDGNVYLPAKISGVCFTDRIGLPMFLSSFRIKLNIEDVIKYQIRETDIPISEKSFIATEETWKNIFTLIQKLTEAQYQVSHICLRDFFYDALLKKQIFTKEEVQVIDESIYDQEEGIEVEEKRQKKSAMKR